jgi:arginine-tRNA-protein transferase
MAVENRFSDFVVYDHIEPCPYLPGRSARMPIRLPLSQVTPEECDMRLARGERRSGRFVYQTQCESCQACEPIRVRVADFLMNRSQRRIWKRGLQSIQVEYGPAVIDQQRIDLFNKHRNLRGLARNSEIDQEGYESFLVESCFETFEMRYYFENSLIGVAICDRARHSISAVYYYFDPDFARLSPGVYSILNQVQYCLEHRLQFLYLGFYVADSLHMKYKQSYRPHERLIGGQWQTFGLT